MSHTETAHDQIAREVTSWPGVEAGIGERGEFAFRLGRRELGHLHGSHVLHVGFPKEVWQTLFDAGRIGYHPVFPGRAGFGARRLETQEDVRDAIALVRLNYDRVIARHGLPEQSQAA